MGTPIHKTDNFETFIALNASGFIRFVRLKLILSLNKSILRCIYPHVIKQLPPYPKDFNHYERDSLPVIPTSLFLCADILHNSIPKPLIIRCMVQEVLAGNNDKFQVLAGFIKHINFPISISFLCNHHRLDFIWDENFEAGITLLHLAARLGKVEVVKALISAGVNHKIHTCKGTLPIDIAAKAGHRDVVLALIQACGDYSAEKLQYYADKIIEIGSSKINTLLMALMTSNHFTDELFTVLVQMGSRVDARDGYGNQIIHVAAAYGCLRGCELLIQHGAGLNVKTSNRTTPLHFAAKNGREDIVALLLDKGALPAPMTRDNCTPLDLAALTGKTNVVHLLVKKLMPPQQNLSEEQIDDLSTTITKLGQVNISPLLASAARNDELIMIDWLVLFGCFVGKKGENEDSKKEDEDIGDSDDYGNKFCVPDVKRWNYPLAEAVEAGHMHCTQKLLEWGANISLSLVKPLIYSTVAGEHEEMIKMLVSLGVDIEEKGDEDGRSALALACAEGKLKAARVLLECGASLTTEDYDDLTPLLLAARNGHVGILQLLLDKGANRNNNKKGKNALHMAASRGKLEAVELLMKNGWELNPKPNQKGRKKKGNAIISSAAKSGNVELLKNLIDTGANTSGAIHKAILAIDEDEDNEESQIKVIEALINCKVDLEEKDSQQHTPLARAILKNNKKIVKLLLQAGAKVESCLNKCFEPVETEVWAHSSFEYAVITEAVDIVTILLDAGIPADKTGRNSPLIAACRYNRKSGVMVELLVSRGADVNQRDEAMSNTNFSALFCAMNSRSAAEKMKVLIKYGANINISPVDKEFTTLLHYCAYYYHHIDEVKALVEAGADVNAPSPKGTPLHQIVPCTYPVKIDTLEYLIEAGGVIDNEESEPHGSVLFHTMTLGSTQIVEYLYPLYNWNNKSKSTTIYVANIPKIFTQEDLTAMFEEWEPTIISKLSPDHASRNGDKNFQFSFVEFKDHENQQKALLAMLHKKENEKDSHAHSMVFFSCPLPHTAKQKKKSG